ncbi:MAG: ATP-binding cassette domain-containing protein [Gemmatimonadota bacterium]
MPAANDVVIHVRDVTKAFRPQRERRTLFRVLRDAVRGRPPEPARRPALERINVSVVRGEKIAVIGNNGAGKSTMLRIVAGLLRPTSGSVAVKGEMVHLTALGVGMIDDVSVLDNTLMYGAIYGIEPKRVRAIFPEVLEWAGISGYEHATLKTLSTGTRARLAFSIVRYIGTDIFLIDEALSAGDVSFREKCRAFFDEPQNASRTFLVATHDMAFARSFCSRTLWIDRGQIRAFGASATVVEEYLAAQSATPRA